MNIFWIEPNMKACAQAMADAHVIKMTLEYAQMLSTAHHILRSEWRSGVYRPTHENHPCTRWVANRPSHYAMLFCLWEATAKEYTARYSRYHKTYIELREVLKNIPRAAITYEFHMGNVQLPPVCAEGLALPPPKDWASVIEQYRYYYSLKVKEGVVTYRRKYPPDWIDNPHLIQERIRCV